MSSSIRRHMTSRVTDATFPTSGSSTSSEKLKPSCCWFVYPYRLSTALPPWKTTSKLIKLQMFCVVRCSWHAYAPHTWIESTVVLKTGLLYFTVRQYFGLLELVRLEPYFSKMFRAVESFCRDAIVWKGQDINVWQKSLNKHNLS